jgi:hypothetical protein
MPRLLQTQAVTRSGEIEQSSGASGALSTPAAGTYLYWRFS